MPDKPSLGEVVRARRTARMMMQEQLAEAAGLDPRTVQRVETKSRASARTLRALANALDVKTAELRQAAGVAHRPDAADLPLGLEVDPVEATVLYRLACVAEAVEAHYGSKLEGSGHACAESLVAEVATFVAHRRDDAWDAAYYEASAYETLDLLDGIAQASLYAALHAERGCGKGSYLVLTLVFECGGPEIWPLEGQSGRHFALLDHCPS